MKSKKKVFSRINGFTDLAMLSVINRILPIRLIPTNALF